MASADYNYEALLEHHFQKLCQALLVREFPGLQCMPVAMPDGGRDAISRESAPERLLFQIKLCRDPSQLGDPVEWLTKAIDGELEKVKRQKEVGVTRYVLITNLGGTSHLDAGSIDTVQRHLDAVMPVQSICWWRDDLDRRLDGAYDVKLRYPAVLNGVDALRAVWEKIASEGDRRRLMAIQAYLRAQHDSDSTVRFKQAELLPSPLFELYVDVPAVSQYNEHSADSGSRPVGFLVHDDPDSYFGLGTPADHSRLIEAPRGEGFYIMHPSGELGLYTGGAADLLLDDRFTRSRPRVVLEGAPGQGKSTLAQYICEVHRVRLLGLSTPTMPKGHQASSVLTPFKLELRDVATWLKGQNPWRAGGAIPDDWTPTLESAIAYHVRHYSGGVDFNVADLLAIAADSPVLLVLDALDEVPSLEDRKAAVDAVRNAVGRLEQNCPFVQVLITSRPSAIADSPSFPRKEYHYLTLTDIDRDLANEYLEKWSAVRRIAGNDLLDIRAVFRDKLDQEHMAELARNAMQLSILLSLIHLRGASLPEKRTALYDTYVDTFLNREAEKSKIVRENRQILHDLHAYLAFYLHSSAEVGQTNGRLSEARLKELVRDYLVREEHPTKLVDELFVGLVERVVALVSRVEGTYEFEVQPLREYFAARFLYDTAPYSPTGNEAAGTKPDRFEAIAPNAYWLNVTRFFAGCFSKGEHADLAIRIKDLIDDPLLGMTTYPRNLAVSLLQDWVFSQSQAATRQLVQASFDLPGLRLLPMNRPPLAYRRRIMDRSTRSTLSLSRSCGSAILADIAWRFVTDNISTPSCIREVCQLLDANSSGWPLKDKWLDVVCSETGVRRTAWIQAGLEMGVLSTLNLDQIADVVSGDRPAHEAERWVAMIAGGARVDNLPEEEWKTVALSLLSSGAVDVLAKRPRGHLRNLDQMTHPMMALELVRGIGAQIITGPLHSPSGGEEGSHGQFSIKQHAVRRVRRAIEGGSEWSSSLNGWREVEGALASTFGKTFRGYEWAVISSCIKNREERGVPGRLLGDGMSCDRVRYARRKPRDVEWWRDQLSDATDETDKMFWVLCSLAWMAPPSLEPLLASVDDVVSSLPDSAQVELARAVDRLRIYPHERPRGVLNPLDVQIFDRIGQTTLVIIASKLDREDRRRLVYDRIRGKVVSDLEAAVVREVVFTDIARGALAWEDSLPIIKGCTAQILTTVHEEIRPFNVEVVARLSQPVAEKILGDAWSYPDEAVIAAEAAISQQLKSPQPVLELAVRDGWFPRLPAPN